MPWYLYKLYLVLIIIITVQMTWFNFFFLKSIWLDIRLQMKFFTKIENEWNEIQYKGDLWNKWNIKSFDKFLEFLKLQAGGFFFSILWGRWCSDRIQEDLAKFAYMSERKLNFFSIPPLKN